MDIYDYKVIPAPRKGKKVKGLRATEDRFAHAVAEVMNTHAAEGWEYLRADVLPCDERKGLTSTVTRYHTLLVFRRPRAATATGEEESGRLRAGPPRIVAPSATTAATAVPTLAGVARSGDTEPTTPLPFPAPERDRD